MRFGWRTKLGMALVASPFWLALFVIGAEHGFWRMAAVLAGTAVFFGVVGLGLWLMNSEPRYDD